MNKVILCGRLTADPRITYSNETADKPQMAIASWSLAVDRRVARTGDQSSADFINCKAFGKLAEHVEKYWFKGMKMILEGHIMTGAYNDKDGRKVYTTEVVADSIEFAESKNASSGNSQSKPDFTPNNTPFNPMAGFSIPNDGDLPFAPVSR